MRTIREALLESVINTRQIKKKSSDLSYEQLHFIFAVVHSTELEYNVIIAFI